MGEPRRGKRSLRAVPKEPEELASGTPYGDTAMAYFDAGWLPFPLHEKQKEKPPVGYTGWVQNKKVNRAQVQRWIKSHTKGNVSTQSIPGYVAPDLDYYKNQAAKDQWDAIREEMGDLPDTWTSSARDDGISGIRHYRVPEHAQGLHWPGTIGDAIQFCHVGHRYPVLPPSLHPKLDADGNNMVYKWYPPGQEPDGNGLINFQPSFEDLAILPDEWIEFFTKGKYARHLPEKDLGPKSVATKKVSEWIAKHDGKPCAEMLRVLDDICGQFDGNAAHDTMRDGFWRLAASAAEHHSGLAEAAERFVEAFRAEVNREGRASSTVRSPGITEDEWLSARDRGAKKIMQAIDDGMYYGWPDPCRCDPLSPSGKPKPKFMANNYRFHAAVDECYDAIAACSATDWDGIFLRNGKLWQVSGQVSRALETGSLRSVVSRATEWYRPAGDGPPAYAVPPRDLIDTLISDAPLASGLPRLRSVVSTPFWAMSDGRPKLVHENGYHIGPEVLLRMSPQMSEKVVDVSGDERWMEHAHKVLADVLVDFPFATPSDRAAAYAAMVQQFVRDLFPGPTPMYLVYAPKEGSGKTELTELISVLSCEELNAKYGFHSIGVTDDRNRNIELTKEINSRLKAESRVIILDNIEHKLDNSALASALSSSEHQARGLGGEDVNEVHNSTLWMGTANNPEVSNEMSRRIIPCYLNPDLESTMDRHAFTHENLIEYAQENRSAMVWACLVFVQNWVDKGCPNGSAENRSYPAWARVVSGILECAGIYGLMDNHKTFKQRSATQFDGVQAFIDEWWATAKTERRTATELSILPSSMELIPEDARSRPQKLGTKIGTLEANIFNGFVVYKGPYEGRTAYWLGVHGEPNPHESREVKARSARKARSRRASRRALKP